MFRHTITVGFSLMALLISGEALATSAQEAMMPAESVQMYSLPYGTSYGADGQYQESGTYYNNAPVYTKAGTSGVTWSLYRRTDGKWYVDYNSVSEAWDGTVASTSASQSFPWSNTAWSNSVVSFRVKKVSVVGVPYASSGSNGDYEFGGTIYNKAPVYTRTQSGTTWSLYKRADGKWYVDYNTVSEDWDGTVAYSSAATFPWSASWNSSSYVVTYTKSVFMYQTPYASSCGTAGDYTYSGTTYNNAPVYTRSGCGYTWSLYKRADGKWYLDYDGVSESWNGTVAYSTATGSNPWSVAWNGTNLCFRDGSVTVQGAPYASNGSAGEYAFTGDIYNNAPVYERIEGSTTWSLYKRSSGSWYVDFNTVSEDWDGTVAYTNSAASSPWSASWNSTTVVTQQFDQ